jgi:hypothetical protein
MKTSVLICATREPTLLPRIVRILYWQGVFPDLLHADSLEGTVRIRLEVDCDDWRLRRLLVHWERIVGVQSVEATRLLGTEPVSAADAHLAPAAR